MAVRRYAGPAFFRTIALGARFTGLYLKLALWLGLGAVLVAVVGIILNILGWGILNAYIGLVLLTALAVVWFIPPMDLAVVLFGAIRAQPGNTPGLSTDDAKKGAAESWAEYKKAFLNIGFYLAVALMFLSFIPVRQAPWMVGFILFAVLFYVLVSEYYNIPMSWAKPIFKWTGVAAITFGFTTLLPPAAWHRVNLSHPSTWGFSKADDLAAEYLRIKFEREEADRAELIKSAITKAKKGEKLTEAEEKALETRTAVGTIKPLVRKASEVIGEAVQYAKQPFAGQTAAGEVNKASTDDAAASRTAGKAPAPVVTPTPAAQTARVIWQGTYVPNQMRMVSLGWLTGRYRVTCERERTQTFFYGGSTPSQEFVMDCQGGYRATKAANGMPIQASPPRVDIYRGDPRPDSTRPFGEIIAMEGNRPVAIAQGQCNNVNGEVQFGLNIRDRDYQHTTGVLQVKVVSC